MARSQNAAFERMKGLTASADLFDLNKIPAKDRERYGPGSFAPWNAVLCAIRLIVFRIEST